MKLSIKDMVHDQCRERTTKFAHDRSNTVGASEIGQCIRKTWFTKHDAPQNPGPVPLKGAAHRGTLIEDHWIVPAMRAGFEKLGAMVKYEGDNQQSIVEGYLSATPDGLALGVSSKCLRHLGVDDIEGDCVALEIKSIDPRYSQDLPKPEHVYQCHVQMGLFRECTNYQPMYALISYTDASFLDDVQEFAIRFDSGIYEAAKARALKIMDTDDVLTLPAEGKISGGNECKYCPFTKHCGEVVNNSVPDGEFQEDLSDTELESLVTQRKTLKTFLDETKKLIVERENDIQMLLRTHNTRKARAGDYAVTWSTVKGRRTLDQKSLIEAARQAGVNVEAFYNQGDTSQRLTIKERK